MKAVIEAKVVHTYVVEIEVSDYSHSDEAIEQINWLMEMKNSSESLIKICETEAKPYIETNANIKVVSVRDEN